jgi:ferredoxin
VTDSDVSRNLTSVLIICARHWAMFVEAAVRVSVDAERCVCSGHCVDFAPQVFRQREDGVSQVIGQPSPEQVAAVREAWDACPVMAIEISED